MRYILAVFLLLSIFLIQTTPKFVSGHENLHRFQKYPWSYMTKFAVAPEQGVFNVRFKFNKPSNQPDLPDKVTLKMLVYRDEEWNKINELEFYEEKAELAGMEIHIEVPLDGTWTKLIPAQLFQKIRTRVWFFVISDVAKNIPARLEATRLQWELEVLNSDRSQFSEEEKGMITPYLVVLTVIVGFFVSNAIKFVKFYKTEESIDYPTLIITFALSLEFLSVFCEVMHLWIYSGDGKGSFIFNFLNQALSVSSQFVIACLLLLMAYGWSINFMKFKDMDVFLPLGIAVGIAHILIVAVSRTADDAHYRYHDYESWAGVFVMLLRILLFVFWVYLYRRTYATAKDNEKTFFNQFGVLSTFYFLAVPLVVMIATLVVAPYWRHRVVTVGTLLLQTVTLVIFTLLFSSKKTKYYQISVKGRSILPSNKQS